jgi:hypothetical protein
LGQRNDVLNEMRVLEQQKAMLDPNDEQVNEINRQIEILENKIDEIDYGKPEETPKESDSHPDDNHSDSDHGPTNEPLDETNVPENKDVPVDEANVPEDKPEEEQHKDAETNDVPVDETNIPEEDKHEPEFHEEEQHKDVETNDIPVDPAVE